ncbi:MAG: rane protein of unknown function [Candidatus Saccharibacteria bacterium]|nr:rane protein of unknown function [Candidatus Saccharibacteria bacterium]
MSGASSKSEVASESSKFGSVPRVVLNVLLIFIGSQIIASLLLAVVLGIFHAAPGALDNSPAAQFFYVFAAEALAAGSVYYILKRRGLSLAAIGLGRRPKLHDLGYAAAGFVAFYILLVGVSIIVGLLYPDISKGSQDIGFNHLNGPLDSVIAFAALVLLPPLGEEPLVRGYLYTGLRLRYKFVPAMIVTSLLFGAAHLLTGFGPGLLWAAGLNTFVLSLVLVFLRERTGALYAGMLVHALNNAVAFGFHFHL